MADPLSIAAGVAGLLSLGIQVTQSLVVFYSAYKDQDTDLANITQSLDNLQGIFRSLDIAVQDRRSRADAQELFQEVEKATQRCDEIIKELHIECQMFHKVLVAGFKGRIQSCWASRGLSISKKVPYRSSKKTSARYVKTYRSH